MYHRLPVLFITCLMVATAASKDSALAHLGKANQLFNEERFEEAAGEFQKALDNNPGLPTARRDLAVCQFEFRQYEPARQRFSELLNDKATASLAHYYLGRIDLIAEKFPSAIAHFRASSSARPFRDERYFLGMAYFKSLQLQNSVKVLNESIEENPRDFRAHQLLARALQKLGKTQAAAAQFQETRRLLGYYTEGSQALKRCGQSLSAATGQEISNLCGPLLETDDVDKLAALGVLLGKAQHFEQARSAWARAASLDPESAEIRYDLALTCFHLKDLGCARENAAAAIQGREDFPEANVLYGSVLYMMGADEEALPALRRAHSLSPTDTGITELLSNELLLWAEQYAKTGGGANARELITELDRLQPLGREQQQRRLALVQSLAYERERP